MVCVCVQSVCLQMAYVHGDSHAEINILSQIDTDASSIVSPADGAISQLGHIESGEVFQANGQSFSVDQVAGPAMGDVSPSAVPMLSGLSGSLASNVA